MEKVLCVRAVSCRRKVSNHKSSPAWPRLESSASGGRRPDHRCLLASAVRPRPVEEGTTRFEKQMFLVFRLFPSKNGKRAHRMLEPMNREKKRTKRRAVSVEWVNSRGSNLDKKQAKKKRVDRSQENKRPGRRYRVDCSMSNPNETSQSDVGLSDGGRATSRREGNRI